MYAVSFLQGAVGLNALHVVLVFSSRVYNDVMSVNALLHRTIAQKLLTIPALQPPDRSPSLTMVKEII